MKMVTALVAVAVFVFAIILMCRQSGVVKEYDFGAGAYYYADIPGFEKIINDDIFVSSVPLWVHIVLFLIWGWLMFRLWGWIDKKDDFMEFKGKTVLITGGGSGIGEAMAYQYAMKGTNVILTGRRMETLEKVQEKCLEYGVRAWCKTVDMEKSESIDELVKWIEAEGHVIDFLLLNAGISQRSLTLETDISVDRRLMEVNYFGGIYLVKSLKDMFIERGVHIAVVSSVSGVFGFPVRSAYCASKHAIHGFYETIALEYPQIKTTILIPGRIHTDVSKNALDGNGKATGVMDPGQANGYDVNKCAKVAIKAIARGKHRKVIGGFDTIMVPFYKYIPCLFRLIARNVSAR